MKLLIQAFNPFALQKRATKRQTREQSKEQQQDIQKRVAVKEAAKAGIKAEQFLATEEQMLQRFRAALANANASAAAKQYVEPQFESRGEGAKAYADTKARIKPKYQQ